MELLITVEAAKRAGARRITAVLPYFMYSRSDKKDQSRVPVTAKLLAQLIEERYNIYAMADIVVQTRDENLRKTLGKVLRAIEAYSYKQEKE